MMRRPAVIGLGPVLDEPVVALREHLVGRPRRRPIELLAQVIEVGGHAPDHPLHPAIAETRYLKSLFCRVVLD